MIGKIAIAAALFIAPSLASAKSVSFGQAPIGSLPKDIEPAQTGDGDPGCWEVVEDAGGDRRPRARAAQRGPYRRPLFAGDPYDHGLSEIEVTIRFEPVSGEVDQAGGIALRLIDARNYYVARANALEDNVRFYRVVGGRREQIAGVDTDVTAGEWHTLTVRAEEDSFTIFYDVEELFRTTDEKFRTPGKVALWTKADSVTRFDSIEIKPLR
jgi:hypothetical protein